MFRAALVLSALAAGSPARAELRAEFSWGDCSANATHVVVVDDKGKVLESWRGDLEPGDTLPLADFKLTLTHAVGGVATDAAVPKKVSGKRLVLFLLKNGPFYDAGRSIGSWSPAHWAGSFDISTVWSEGGYTFTMGKYFSTTSPWQLLHRGKEADLRKQVAEVGRQVDGVFKKAQAEPDAAKRAAVLAGVLTKYPGFAGRALGGLEWCGEAALPALRTVLRHDRVCEPVTIGVYQTMARIGEPAREDLVELCAGNVEFWTVRGNGLGLAGTIPPEFVPRHRALLAALENPDAFKNAKGHQRTTLKALRDLWAEHEVLSKLGTPGDRVADRLDKALAAAGQK